jgi:hypothetical protein
MAVDGWCTHVSLAASRALDRRRAGSESLVKLSGKQKWKKLLGSPFESEHSNNAWPPIEPAAAAGKCTSEATAVGLAVASRALRTAVVSVGLWLRLPLVSCLLATRRVHHAATTLVVSFVPCYTHLW